jgi:hypothetical protein
MTKYLKKNQLKRKKVYFGSWFQSMVGWLHCFGPVERQNLRHGACDGIKQFSLW